MNVSKLSQQLRRISRWIIISAALISLCASAFYVQPVRAFTPIFVDADAPDGGDGFTWASALNDLHEAINMAVAGDEIWVAAGTYYPSYLLIAEDVRSASFIMKNGVAIYGGFNGTETDLSQRNWTTNVTTLSGLITPTTGDPYHVYHVVYGSGMMNPATRLDGFTITGGTADLDPGHLGGGGLHLDHTAMTLTNLVISGNVANNLGGGMNISYSPAVIQDVTFLDNTGLHGGGMYSHANEGLTLTNVTFQGNVGTADGGGLNEYDSTLLITNSVFIDNQANDGGGGIYSTDSNSRILNTTFDSNLAGADGVVGTGGAMHVQSAEQVWVQDCTFTNNDATGAGGAVRNVDAPSVWYRNTFVNNHTYAQGGAFSNYTAAPWIGNSTFYGNEAESMGGAVDLTFVSTGVITNSIFMGNHAVQGGAIRINGPHSSPRLTNLTIANNSVSGGAPKGAGVFQMGGSTEANSTVYNSIIYGNTGAAEVWVYDAQMDLHDSIVGSFQPEGTGVNIGSGFITSNPLFIDANGADNIAGNADDDYRIPSNSPAVDTGVAGDVDLIDIDNDDDMTEAYPYQMGTGPRIADLANAPLAAPSTTPAIDMGAYEAQPPVLAVTKTAGGTPSESTPFPVMITVTNNGLGTANDVVISDTLPAGMSMVTGSLIRSIGEGGTLPVLARNFDLLPGETATVEFEAIIADGPASTTNTAQATAYEVPTAVTGSVVVNVVNLPPHDVTVTIPVGTIYEGNAAQFNSAFVDPAGNLDSPFTFLWDFDDGAPVAGAASQSHTYHDSGVYQVVLQVTDNDGGSASSPATPVTITNVPPVVSINPITTGLEGTEMNFTGAFTDVAEGLDAPFSYTWTLDADRVIESGTVTTYNPASPPVVTASAAMGAGTHTVRLTVTDKDGGSRSVTSPSFTVTDVAPEVTINATGSPVEGSPFTFTATVIDPGSNYGETFTYRWSFGGVIVDGTQGVQQYTFPDSGDYNVTVTVTGSHGGTDTSPVFPVVVSNVAPAASINPIGAINEGQEYNFTGTFTDPAGSLDTLYTYQWRVDGAVHSGGTVSTYDPLNPPVVAANLPLGTGEHTITLQVTDADGAAGNIASATFNVANVAPSVDLSPAPEVYDDIAHTYTVAFTDPGQGFNETYTIRWNFGDGTVVDNAGLTQAHTYTSEGDFTVTVRVTDSHGGYGEDSYVVTSRNSFPIATLGDITGSRVEGSTLTFNGSGADRDPFDTAGEDIVNYAWSFGDGTVIADGSTTETHVYRDNGSYTIQFTVTDNEGKTHAVQTTVVVANANPVVNAGNSASGKTNTPMQFLGSFTDAGLDDTHTIVWNFGDGTTATGILNPTHIYIAEGTYIVTLTVTDKDGGVGSDTTSANVQQYRYYVPILGGGNP